MSGPLSKYSRRCLASRDTPAFDLLALDSVAGIAWIVITRSLTSVDGLFMSLILLTLSGVFFLNVVLEAQARGWLASLQKKKPLPSKEPPAAKAG